MKRTVVFSLLLFPFLSGSGCGEPNIGFAPPPAPPPGHFDTMPPGFENNQSSRQEIPGKMGQSREIPSSSTGLDAQTEKAITDLIVKDAAGKSVNTDLGAIAKRIKNGEPLRKILSPYPFPDRMSIHEMGPVPVIGGLFIPFAAIAGVCFVFVLFLRLRHKRDVLLIEKGLFRTEDLQGFRVDAALLVTGTVLLFWGISLSLFNLLSFGASTRTFAAGVIPFIVGIGCFAAFFLFRLLISLTPKK
jgi:hypothetical protein